MVILFTSLSERYAFVRRARGDCCCSRQSSFLVHSTFLLADTFTGPGRFASRGRVRKKTLLETVRFVECEGRETERRGDEKILVVNDERAERFSYFFLTKTLKCKKKLVLSILN